MAKDDSLKKLAETDPAKAAYSWRRRAETMRAIADAVGDGPTKVKLYGQAQRWDEMAANAEKGIPISEPDTGEPPHVH